MSYACEALSTDLTHSKHEVNGINYDSSLDHPMMWLASGTLPLLGASKRLG